MGERVTVNEVGLRDGLQMYPRPVAVADKLAMLRSLRASGLASFEATSFVSPKAVPQLADAAELVAALPADDAVHYAVLVPNERGLQRATEAGVRSIAVVLSATETLNRKNINMSLEQAIATCEAVTAAARGQGMFVRAYVAAAAACPYEGPTPASRVRQLSERMFAAGAQQVAIADTIGAGAPGPMAALFRSLVADFGAARLAAHFHDTRAMGATLAWVALQEGIRTFDSSIGGLGGCPFAPGAAGNLATEDLIFLLHENGYETGIDFERLMQAVTEIETLLGSPIGGRIRPWYLAQQARAARGSASG